MRFSDNFHPEWGFLAPARGVMRTLRIVVVATAIGASAGGAVVFSLMDRSDSEELVAARTLAQPVQTTLAAASAQASAASMQAAPSTQAAPSMQSAPAIQASASTQTSAPHAVAPQPQPQGAAREQSPLLPPVQTGRGKVLVVGVEAGTVTTTPAPVRAAVAGLAELSPISVSADAVAAAAAADAAQQQKKAAAVRRRQYVQQYGLAGQRDPGRRTPLALLPQGWSGFGFRDDF